MPRQHTYICHGCKPLLAGWITGQQQTTGTPTIAVSQRTQCQRMTPSTHPQLCKPLLTGWIVGATADDKGQWNRGQGCEGQKDDESPPPPPPTPPMELGKPANDDPATTTTFHHQQLQPMHETRGKQPTTTTLPTPATTIPKSTPTSTTIASSCKKVNRCN